MRLAAKIDSNQSDIVTRLRTIPGCKVAITSQVGAGFPDLVIGFMGKNHLVELKDGSKPPSKRKLTPDEKRFHDQWTGQINTCDNLDDVLAVLGISTEPPPF
jgi:hypothetical protein